MKLNKKYIALNNLIILQRGFDLPEIERVIGNIPVVASTGIIGSHNIAKVKGPGVVIGRSGSIGGGQYVAGDFWPLNTTLWVKDFKEHNPRFIYYVLKNIDFSRFNFGTGVPTLNRNHIANIKVLAFDKSQEEKIADILSKYDDLIENNRRRIELLERSARLLYKEWFVRLRFPGHEHTPIIDGIPEGWEKGQVSDFYKTASGGTPSRKNPDFFTGDINWVKTQELNNSFIFKTDEKITEEAIKNSSAKIFPAHTVLVAMYGATIGQTAILANSATTNQACCGLLPDCHIANYIHCFLFFRENKQILANLSLGAAQNNISQEIIRNFPMLLPSKKVMDIFWEFTNRIFEQIKILEQQNQKLKQARDILLPKLMNGEIEV